MDELKSDVTKVMMFVIYHLMKDGINLIYEH